MTPFCYFTADELIDFFSVTLGAANLGDDRFAIFWHFVEKREVKVAKKSQGQSAWDGRSRHREKVWYRLIGTIAAVERKWPTAAYWFARAVADAPSPPFAYTDWGQMLLARGDHDGAIAKFTIANQKGPHFADPLEGWGEALTAKGDYRGAVKKFAEAERHAPRWGRLNIQWGIALARLGKPAEARAKWTRALTLDLSPADRAQAQTLLAGAKP